MSHIARSSLFQLLQATKPPTLLCNLSYQKKNGIPSFSFPPPSSAFSLIRLMSTTATTTATKLNVVKSSVINNNMSTASLPIDGSSPIPSPSPSPNNNNNKNNKSPLTAPPKTGVWKRIWTNDWITEEGEYYATLAYNHHKALMDHNPAAPPRIPLEHLESMGVDYTYPPQTTGDKIARVAVRALLPFTHFFFKTRYNHHACVLETVAAVPGMVAAMFRHMRSLRTMQRDNGWINPLLEEAENERMHLLTWMTVTQPTRVEKTLVLSAQAFYFALYSFLYTFFPRIAHRFVGYLEEEAVRAYTLYLGAIDKGELPNGPAPAIAINYWQLPADATIRDVILYVRADECQHRNVNHHFADLHCKNQHMTTPMIPCEIDPQTLSPKTKHSQQ